MWTIDVAMDETCHERGPCPAGHMPSIVSQGAVQFLAAPGETAAPAAVPARIVSVSEGYRARIAVFWIGSGGGEAMYPSQYDAGHQER